MLTTATWLDINGEVEGQNKSLQKALEIANPKGKDLKAELSQSTFIAMFRKIGSFTYEVRERKPKQIIPRGKT